MLVPSPSWPQQFSPQHLAAPALVSTHVLAFPPAIALTSTERPWTSCGMRRRVQLPSPTCPRAFAPQHLALPATVTAHACVTPAVMAVAPAVAGVSCEAA